MVTKKLLDANNFITFLFALAMACTWFVFKDLNQTITAFVATSATINTYLHRIYER